ncbi:hypothetical protein NDU88_005548 [Pleurodeles waltl]|uniref:Uncharacterized protein n=1 Tax=Pleurodeles waltl TaxID=8319 RepID=A0AAV7TAT5_PLEWA|nr:hypothetical protein NDU88_005548 [Pleurodeles waltl]
MTSGCLQQHSEIGLPFKHGRYSAVIGVRASRIGTSTPNHRKFRIPRTWAMDTKGFSAIHLNRIYDFGRMKFFGEAAGHSRSHNT